MIEYVVHFEKGYRVGARSLRMVHVKAEGVKAAIKAAKVEMKGEGPGFRLKRVDHYDDDEGRIVIDY